MASKQAILDNVAMYTADELVSYINAGIVTFDELCDETDGEFSRPMRREVESKLKGSEDDAWAKARLLNTIDAYANYLSSYPAGKFVAQANAAIQQLSRPVPEVEETVMMYNDSWETVDKDDVEALRTFIECNPTDPNIRAARKRINELELENFRGYDKESLVKRIKAIQTDRNVLNRDGEIFNVIKDFLDRRKITEQELLDLIRDDHNILRSTVVSSLLDEGYLQVRDLYDIGIRREFISHMAGGEQAQGFAIPDPIESINKVSSEIYFWGIPSSGKSCALGAILSVANSGRVAKSMRKDNDCQGYGYMSRLSQLFQADGTVGTLPEGTSIYSTYEMGFDLEDENDLTHPITCIDLAGELVRCMYKNDAGEDMTDDEMNALDTLTRVLIDNRTKNRKIHFFVIEYGAEDRKYEGLTQQTYLEAALNYIERTGIFKKDTSAIYLMITKVDKIKARGADRQQVLREYVSNNYGGFYNGLVRICRDCEINNGAVDIIPFSLGRVCFQDYCLFNESAAANVVRKLLDRTKGFRHDKIGKFAGLFKS